MDQEGRNEGDKKIGQTPPQTKQQHPPLHYSVTQLYMIRKESITHSSDLIIKRLHRCFQRIKKYKEAKREHQLNEPYQVENSKVRKDFRRLHELYKNGSKINQITELKIKKMKRRVENSKMQLNVDENYLTRDIDLTRLYIKHSTSDKSTHHHTK